MRSRVFRLIVFRHQAGNVRLQHRKLERKLSRRHVDCRLSATSLAGITGLPRNHAIQPAHLGQILSPDRRSGSCGHDCIIEVRMLSLIGNDRVGQSPRAISQGGSIDRSRRVPDSHLPIIVARSQNPRARGRGITPQGRGKFLNAGLDRHGGAFANTTEGGGRLLPPASPTRRQAWAGPSDHARDAQTLGSDFETAAFARSGTLPTRRHKLIFINQSTRSYLHQHAASCRVIISTILYLKNPANHSSYMLPHGIGLLIW